MHHSRNFSFGAVIQANQSRKHDNNINGASINFSYVVVLFTRDLFCVIQEVAHGSPRTSTTQGLVERSNRSWKEDMRVLIMSTSSTSVQKWC